MWQFDYNNSKPTVWCFHRDCQLRETSSDNEYVMPSEQEPEEERPDRALENNECKMAYLEIN